MTLFLLNIFLALIWVALAADFRPVTLAGGYLIGYVVLWILFGKTETYFQKVPRTINLTLFFMWELLVANVRVAGIILGPRSAVRPGIIAVPLDIQTDLEITLLANLLTLTPGTLTLEVSEDRKVLYIHFLQADDPAELRRKIKEGFERRVREVFE